MTLFIRFVSMMIQMGKYDNIKLVKDTTNHYFTTFGDFTFHDIGIDAVKVTSSQYSRVFKTIEALLLFEEGIR